MFAHTYVSAKDIGIEAYGDFCCFVLNTLQEHEENPKSLQTRL